jgi:YidC/Oxa1 family membrane protein insertase
MTLDVANLFLAGAAQLAPLTANILQPLIAPLEAIIKFLHDDVGMNWALAIIGLTFIVRLVVLPLSLRGIKSMRRMQIIAPELKRIQEKYKDDRQRMQQETMKVYQESGINPLSSCLPLLIQFPFFIAIYQLLRGSGFKDDVLASGNPGGLLVHSVVAAPTGAELIVLIVLFIATTAATFFYTMSVTPTATGAQRYLFMIFPLIVVPFIINAPAGLAVYWIATNVWALGQQLLVQRVMPAPPPPTPEEAKAAKPPPPPPRKKKRRRR